MAKHVLQASQVSANRPSMDRMPSGQMSVTSDEQVSISSDHGLAWCPEVWALQPR